ncbi:hypothetical protein TNCV_2937322 [Trichonephila clavipes]|nr:hypothetical protein TNCV_2937322 [Trichonephila clavipes]
MYALIGEKLVALVPYEEANIFALKNVGQLLGLYRPVSSPVSTFFSPRSHSLLLRACIYKVIGNGIGHFSRRRNTESLSLSMRNRTYDEWDDVLLRQMATLPLTPTDDQ